MQSAACTHARQRFLPPSSLSSFPKLNQMGFSISFSLYNAPTLLPALPLPLQAMCQQDTGHKGFAEVTRTITELPPAMVSGWKTLQTQWHRRAVLPCWAAWTRGADNSAGTGMNYYFCLEERRYGHYYFFGRKSSNISALGSSRGTRLSRKGRRQGKGPTTKLQLLAEN